LGDPYANWLGIRVDEAEKGRSSCSVVITEKMLNFLGVVHGGLIFSLADVAFSVASNKEGPVAYAIDVSGSFFKSAKVGDKLTAKATRVYRGRRTGAYRMDVFHNDELIATFNGTVLINAE
jgi:acyl-CoA thioesterase